MNKSIFLYILTILILSSCGGGGSSGSQDESIAPETDNDDSLNETCTSCLHWPDPPNIRGIDFYHQTPASKWARP